jgi:hypothetical protein
VPYRAVTIISEALHTCIVCCVLSCVCSVAVVVSVLLTVSQTFWKLIVKQLTRFERHDRMTTYRCVSLSLR